APGAATPQPAAAATPASARAPPAVAPRPAPSQTAPVATMGGNGETAEDRLRRKSTPLVRKIAAEHQVDISQIPGTGFAGRVTKQDILGFIERAPAGAPAPPTPRTRPPTPPGTEHPAPHPSPRHR